MSGTRLTNQRGFSLLEAIVALVILSSVALAILSWTNSNLLSLARIEAQQNALLARRAALNYLDTVNPMASPGGEQSLGRWRVSWRAEPVRPLRSNVNRYGAPGLFDVALYEVDVVVEEAGQVLDRFSVRQVGWVQARQSVTL
jgi:general secretion pathway protein I